MDGKPAAIQISMNLNLEYALILGVTLFKNGNMSLKSNYVTTYYCAQNIGEPKR